MVSIHQVVQQWQGPEVLIDCPVCHARSVSAATHDQESREKLYGLIPLNTVRSSWVVCSGCHTALRSRVRVDELEGKTPGEMADFVYADAGFIRKTFAIVALLTCLFPFVGPVIAAIMLIANWKLPGWPRTLSWIATGVSLVATGFVVLLLIFDAMGLLK